MEKKKSHHPIHSSSSQTPHSSQRNSSQEVFSIYNKKSMFRSSTNTDTDLQSSFVSGISAYQKQCIHKKHFDMISQMSKLNEKYFSVITVQAQNRKWLALVDNFTQNCTTTETLAIGEALTYANSRENISTYYFFGQYSMGKQNLEDKLLQSVRKYEFNQLQKDRKLLFFHGIESELLLKNIVEHNYREWNAYTNSGHDNQSQEEEDQTLAVHNQYDECRHHQARGFKQNQKNINYQRVLAESQLQSYTMISHFSNKNSQSQKLIHFLNQIQLNTIKNSNHKTKSKIQAKNFKKPCQKTQHKTRKDDRISKNVSRKNSHKKCKKSKSNPKPIHRISEFNGGKFYFDTQKFDQISAILPNSINVQETKIIQKDANIVKGEQKKGKAFQAMDYRFDNQYFHQKSYLSTYAKTCSATPKNHSRMPSQLLYFDQNHQNTKPEKIFDKIKSNMLASKVSVKLVSKDKKKMKKKDLMTAQNSLIKANSVNVSPIATPRLSKLLQINAKQKQKKSVDKKPQMKSQKIVQKSLSKVEKQSKDHENRSKRKMRMAENKQNLNQKIELNEYGVNFGAIANKNSVMNIWSGRGLNKVQRKQRGQILSEEQQIWSGRRKEKYKQVQSGRSQKSKQKKSIRNWFVDDLREK